MTRPEVVSSRTTSFDSHNAAIVPPSADRSNATVVAAGQPTPERTPDPSSRANAPALVPKPVECTSTSP